MFDIPCAFRRISTAIADQDYPLALRAIEDARSVLDETARLARLSIPEGAVSHDPRDCAGRVTRGADRSGSGCRRRVAHAVKASFDAHERAEIRAFRRRLAARDRDASGSGGGR
ncbi:hypothetical protein [Actinocatenispora sera]|uniref:Uncharacterized protein n=1 Tax=Actinocatenispora sera TaxID=390989 RepID=A0A810L5J4_9ACTN|nr:hypothetical protein [Actinocatenispora sera]BCJ29656.1 hypothetical protein Asera_37640 [Actinocatenispora sera]